MQVKSSGQRELEEEIGNETVQKIKNNPSREEGHVSKKAPSVC